MTKVERREARKSLAWIAGIVVGVLVLLYFLSGCNEPVARPVAPAPSPGTAVVAAPVGPALGADPYAPGAPVASRPYARTVTREARAFMGLSAPVAMFGAQIETESAWRPNAHSVYAAGLAQFIPATARDMERRYPVDLGNSGPLNPEWSIRALVLYDRDLYRPISAATDCDRWAFTLSAYNGGPGWISRDRNMCEQHEGCDTSRWWNNVELRSGRSRSNFDQNREYPRRILKDRQPSYRPWGGFVTCNRS